MDPTLVGIVAIVLMLALIAIGVPIGFALGIVGVAGNVLVIGLPQTALQIQLIAWESGNNFLLIAAPLFILMGQLVYHAGIASDLYDCTHKWFGRLPGGLAVTSVITSAAFGGGDIPGGLNELAKLVVCHFRRIHPEPGNTHSMKRRFVGPGKFVIAAHRKFAASDPHHSRRLFLSGLKRVWPLLRNRQLKSPRQLTTA